MSPLILRITVPVCSFRKGTAREFLESENYPPPSTVLGFLMSLIGEEDIYKYPGVKLAIAIFRKPERSVVLRTTWRVKKSQLDPGTGENAKPDFQEVLTGLDFAVVVTGPDEFLSRLNSAVITPSNLTRYGGLSLGESRDLVNDVCIYNDNQSEKCLWIRPEKNGKFPLTVKVDHVGSKGTIWMQASIIEGNFPGDISDEYYFSIPVVEANG